VSNLVGRRDFSRALSVDRRKGNKRTCKQEFSAVSEMLL
jgi:hypothetical protein